MRKLAILAILVAGTSTAFAAPAPKNESFIAQIGYGNGAIVYQQGGNNSQATLSFGKRNFAFTGQVVADPSDKSSTNGSLTLQFGSDNSAITGQYANGNANNAMTFQAGHGNTAVTLQDSAVTNNNAMTSQIGSHNFAVTLQH